MIINRTKPGCNVQGCNSYSPNHVKYRAIVNAHICNHHFNCIMYNKMKIGYGYNTEQQPRKKPTFIDDKVWILINNRELSFSEKLARLLGEEIEKEFLTVGDL